MIKQILEIAYYIDIIQRIREKQHDVCDPMWYELFKTFHRNAAGQLYNIWEPENLPHMSDRHKTVTLPIERLASFRRDFSFMHNFIALILRTPKWGKIDVMRFSGTLEMLYRRVDGESND